MGRRKRIQHWPFFCLLALSFALASPAEAQGQSDPFDFDFATTSQESDNRLRISGTFTSRNQHLLEQSSFLSARQRAFLEGKWSSEKLRLVLSGWTEYDRANRDFRDPWYAELTEAYAFFDGETVDVTLGRQRVAWGVADGRSTIDILNAIDLRDPIGNARTPSRRPSWMARVEYRLDYGTLEAAFLPIGRNRSLAGFGNPWELDELNALRRADLAGDISLDIQKSSSPEGGIRFARFGQGFDWSVAVFSGKTDAPLPFQESETEVRLSPERFTTFNVSTAIGAGKSTWRGEFAFSPNTPIGLGQSSDLTQVIVGWDRTFFTDLYANIQVFTDVFSNRSDIYGATFALTKPLFDGGAEIGVRGQVGNNNTFSAEAFVDYVLNDNVSLAARLFVLDGNAQSDFASFRDNDFVELSLVYSF